MGLAEVGRTRQETVEANGVSNGKIKSKQTKKKEQNFKMSEENKEKLFCEVQMRKNNTGINIRLIDR